MEDNYRLWQEACLKEYNENFEAERVLYEEDSKEPCDLIEFGEDGTAYPHGIGGTNYIKNAVTPWGKSGHYCPFKRKNGND